MIHRFNTPSSISCLTKLGVSTFLAEFLAHSISLYNHHSSSAHKVVLVPRQAVPSLFLLCYPKAVVRKPILICHPAWGNKEQPESNLAQEGDPLLGSWGSGGWKQFDSRKTPSMVWCYITMAIPYTFSIVHSHCIKANTLGNTLWIECTPPEY